MPSPLAALLTASLATYRLTRLVTDDVITEPLRDRIFTTFGDPSTPAARYTPSYVVTCPHCASVYASIAAALLVTAASSPSTGIPRPVRALAQTLSLALAAAGAVSLYHEHTATTATHAASGWASS